MTTRTEEGAAEDLSVAPVGALARPARNKETPLLVAVVILASFLVAALSVGGYFYYQYRQTPAVAEAREMEDLIGKLGQTLTLPEGEQPTLATVTDREKLAGQAFFRLAENGDKVIIYTEAGKAILYRPATGKIIDMTSVNTNTAVTEEAPIASEPAVAGEEAVVETEAAPAVAPTPVRVALYNGSTRLGVTYTLETDMKSRFPEVVIDIKEKAAKKDYQGNTIVDLSGKHADFANSLVASIGGTVGSLPEGETAPDADILVIVGNK